MEKTESTVSVAEGNDDTKCTIQQTNTSVLSHAQSQYCKVEMSDESYQARARSGSPKNGCPTTPSLLAGQVSESAEKPLGCNQGSASTAVILEKDDHVKQTGEAILANLCKRKCSWGLIWRKKKLDLNTWEDFVSRKVILNGNPDMCPLTPTCHYCSQPYDSDLMYIQCETCPSWYHADAVGLEEKKIHDLVGFKCCKCRKIRKPACPYSAPEYRRSLEVKRLQVKASTVDNTVGPCHGSVEEQQDLQSKSTEETPHAAQNNHLTVASSQIQPQSENNLKLYHELDFAIDSGPQKLPIRRSVKHEKEETPLTADDSVEG
ncbi:hypothetical protein Leryth_021495 [Lithospermum erythrorhizon]|nr:hypothetical protein Leryth_021495 [Lithospermum erythrorhizon]